MNRESIRSILLACTLTPILALGLSGCGGDKKAKPTRPDPVVNNSVFDQSNALAQSQTAALQAVALVQSMETLARGFGKKQDEGYGWNESEKRWEWHYDWNQAGYTYNWLYLVQYRNAAGQPQQNAAGAASVLHSMSGTGDYVYESGETSLDYDYRYAYDVTLSDLATTARLMNGSGHWDIDYTYRSGAYNQTSKYLVEWETLPPGIAFAEGGCPTGTIRYAFSPYTMTLVFNGGPTAVATLRDSAGNPVAGGGGSYPLSCTAE